MFGFQCLKELDAPFVPSSSFSSRKALRAFRFGHSFAQSGPLHRKQPSFFFSPNFSWVDSSWACLPPPNLGLFPFGSCAPQPLVNFFFFALDFEEDSPYSTSSALQLHHCPWFKPVHKVEEQLRLANIGELKHKGRNVPNVLLKR